MKLPLVLYPDAALSQPCSPFADPCAVDRAFIQNMIETMVAQRGVGLAASQVGVSKQIFIASIDGTASQVMVVVNPTLSAQAGEVLSPEGCLSLPGISCDVRRARVLELQGFDERGKAFRKRIEGFLARIVQHEVDHLSGKLLIDRVGYLERNAILASLGKRA